MLRNDTVFKCRDENGVTITTRRRRDGTFGKKYQMRRVNGTISEKCFSLRQVRHWKRNYIENKSEFKSSEASDGLESSSSPISPFEIISLDSSQKADVLLAKKIYNNSNEDNIADMLKTRNSAFRYTHIKNKEVKIQGIKVLRSGFDRLPSFSVSEEKNQRQIPKDLVKLKLKLVDEVKGKKKATAVEAKRAKEKIKQIVQNNLKKYKKIKDFLQRRKEEIRIRQNKIFQRRKNRINKNLKKIDNYLKKTIKSIDFIEANNNTIFKKNLPGMNILRKMFYSPSFRSTDETVQSLNQKICDEFFEAYYENFKDFKVRHTARGYKLSEKKMSARESKKQKEIEKTYTIFGKNKIYAFSSYPERFFNVSNFASFVTLNLKYFTLLCPIFIKLISKYYFAGKLFDILEKCESFVYFVPHNSSNTYKNRVKILCQSSAAQVGLRYLYRKNKAIKKNNVDYFLTGSPYNWQLKRVYDYEKWMNTEYKSDKYTESFKKRFSIPRKNMNIDLDEKNFIKNLIKEKKIKFGSVMNVNLRLLEAFVLPELESCFQIDTDVNAYRWLGDTFIFMLTSIQHELCHVLDNTLCHTVKTNKNFGMYFKQGEFDISLMDALPSKVTRKKMEVIDNSVQGKDPLTNWVRFETGRYGLKKPYKDPYYNEVLNTTRLKLAGLNNPFHREYFMGLFNNIFSGRSPTFNRKYTKLQLKKKSNKDSYSSMTSSEVGMTMEMELDRGKRGAVGKMLTMYLKDGVFGALLHRDLYNTKGPTIFLGESSARILPSVANEVVSVQILGKVKSRPGNIYTLGAGMGGHYVGKVIFNKYITEQIRSIRKIQYTDDYKYNASDFEVEILTPIMHKGSYVLPRVSERKRIKYNLSVQSSVDKFLKNCVIYFSLRNSNVCNIVDNRN